MVASIVERLKVRIDEDDPAFVIVELNRLALEATATAIVEHLQPLPGRIDDAAKRLLAQVDATATHRTAEAVAHASILINSELVRATKVASRLLEDVAIRNRAVGALKWCVLAGIGSLILVAVGYAAGFLHADARADGDRRHATALLTTVDGKAALKLAELGQATALVNCSGYGWVMKGEFCFGTPKDGKTVGWRIK